MYSELNGIDFVIFYNNHFQKWESVDIRDREELDGQGYPWYKGAYGNCLIWLKNAKVTDTLYLVSAEQMIGKTWQAILNEDFLKKYAVRYVTRDGVFEIPRECRKLPRMRKSTIKKYMQYVSSIEKNGLNRMLYHVGSNFLVEVVICKHDKNNKSDIMHKWVGRKSVSAFLPTHIDIKTYYTDKNNNQVSKYNIMNVRSQNGKHMMLNFDYVREATPENIEELVAECIRLYMRSCRNS